MPIYFAIGLLALFIALPIGDAFAARAKDKLPIGEINPLELPAANAMVERVQRALAAASYYSGAVDGRFNEQTDRAIRLYQRRQGLLQTGIASKQLAVHIETSSKVRSLLRQLQQQRQSKIDEARAALLTRPETRDLVTPPGQRDKTATADRDPSHCFAAPTAKCLLEEASESAIAIFKPEHRDWALGDILVTAAKAGLVDEAMKTVRLIGDPRLIMVALRDIAKAQAAAGRPLEALAAAAIIPDLQKRLEALAAIATIQLSRNDAAGARETAHNLLDAVEQVKDALKRVSLATRAVTVIALAGEADMAAVELARIKAKVETTTQNDLRSAALRHIANAYAETGKPAQALEILKQLPDVSEHTPVLVSAATAQARAGDSELAISTAQSIEAVRYRAVVLSRIAIAQAKSGNGRAGRTTLDTALDAAATIKRPFAKAYAYERIALALFEIGRFGGPATFALAIETARLIRDDKLRAQTLWTLASGQTIAGDQRGGEQTAAMAETATDEIKSPFSRVWMFSEITLQHLSAGETSSAWTAFNRALAIAEGINGAWARSRALARLASALTELPIRVEKE